MVNNNNCLQASSLQVQNGKLPKPKQASSSYLLLCVDLATSLCKTMAGRVQFINRESDR